MKSSIHKKINTYIAGALVIGLFIISAAVVNATTPNPGHPWTEVGDGTFAVTGPTVARTYTFPDANSTILTSNSAVTVAQGGSGATTLTGILKGNGTSAFTTVTAPSGALVGDTDTQTLTNKTISAASNTLTGVAGSGANSDITSLSALSTPLSVAQGGTGAATLTADNLLVGNGTSAPTFLDPSSSDTYVKSNGTTWTVSTLPSTTGNVTRALSGNAASNATMSSLTVARVGYIRILNRITINTMNLNINTVTSSGTLRVCIYDEAGTTKLVDAVSGTISGTGNTQITVSPAVTLEPGNYYLRFACATACNLAVGINATISNGLLNTAAVPSGKPKYEGTVTHASGVCNSTVGTITGGALSTALIRLEN